MLGSWLYLRTPFCKFVQASARNAASNLKLVYTRRLEPPGVMRHSLHPCAKAAKSKCDTAGPAPSTLTASSALRGPTGDGGVSLRSNADAARCAPQQASLGNPTISAFGPKRRFAASQ